MIFNITSAFNCVSRKKGLCQLENPNKCYAWNLEKFRPNYKTFHEKQNKLWDRLKASDIAISLYNQSNPLIKWIRFNESGDFRGQSDVDKLFDVCLKYREIDGNMGFYGYTARKDLDFDNKPSNLTVNGSGFMLDNCFKAVDKPDKSDCINDCLNCDLCKKANNKTIIEVLR